jgi:hypothetical protein
MKCVADTSSLSLKDALDGMLSRHGLSMSKVRGQGYDGASNMRGEFHGLQRRVLDQNRYAFYIHCFAHQLQLVVVSVAKCCGSIAITGCNCHSRKNFLRYEGCQDRVSE